MHTLQYYLEQPFALHQGRVVTRGMLWADVNELAKQLPDRPFVFNLCKNRYLFCVCLLAAATRGQVCLLPPSEQMSVIQEIQHDYPNTYIASENTPADSSLAWFAVKVAKSEAGNEPIAFDWERTAVIAFTSGSTGKPKPCTHSLQTFRTSAEMALRSLSLTDEQRLMVSTTPQQHMYGLETSVFWPLFSNLILHDGRPFYSEDIRHAIETSAWPTLLASTPTHLNSLVNAAGPWTNLTGVISATDTLSEKLAQQIQAILGQSPYEIYGSTETLSFAWRETLRNTLWQPYIGSRLLQNEPGRTRLLSPHLRQPTILSDSFDIAADGRFTVLSRHHDMIKIGGKRASLSELNRRLKDLDGVDDGFFFVQPQEFSQGRLAAVVVSQLDKRAIRMGLKPYLDEVFLPRKIHFVNAIPRNPTGKLTKTEMDNLLAGLV